jgi:hypothetical protein
MSATATSARRAAPERGRTPRGRTGPGRPPRRVSGPVGGRARVAAAARAAAMPRESVALSERALALVRGLPDHSLIDRLVRSRAWIPVLGVLLAGIVAMQVEILKLGSAMGHSVERASLLQTQNESLRASVAGLVDDQRIERLAVGMGMSMPRPESLVFLQARPGGGLAKALANIHAPDPTGFLGQLAAQAAAAAALMPPAPASTSGTAGSSGASSSAATAVPQTSAATATPAPTATSAPAVTSAPTVAGTSAPTTSQTSATTGVPSTTAASATSGTGGGVGVAPVAAPQSGGSTGG